MAMKGCSVFPKAPALLRLHHQTVWCHIQDTHLVGGLTPAELHSVYSTTPADWANIDRALSGATTLVQSGPGSNSNEGVLCIPQSSSITGTSPSDCLLSYQDTHWRGPYPSTEVQSVYSTAPADWTRQSLSLFIFSLSFIFTLVNPNGKIHLMTSLFLAN